MRRVKHRFAFMRVNVELRTSVFLRDARPDYEQHVTHLDVDVMLTGEAPHVDLD